MELLTTSGYREHMFDVLRYSTEIFPNGCELNRVD
jgi:hypothetical protein